MLAVNGQLPLAYTVGDRSYEVTDAASIKGLERAHVVVTDVADLTVSETRAAAYVAMTRPRYSLYVVSSPEAYQTMGQNALQYIQQQVEKVGARNE